MAENVDTQIIYLFTTDSSNLYKRDLLNVCCFEEGRIVKFGYRKEWLPDNVSLCKDEHFNGKEVVIIYCEPRKNGDAFYYYHPLRRAVIEGVDRDVTGAITFSVKLGRILDCSNEGLDKWLEDFQDNVNNSPSRPRTFISDRANKTRKFFYVVKDRDYISGVWSDWSNSWRSFVGHCLSLKGLDESYFMRMVQNDSNSYNELGISFEKDLMHWEAKSDKKYSLSFEVVGPKKAKSDPEIESDEHLADVIGPFVRQLGGGSKVEFVVAPKKVYSRESGNFRVRVLPEKKGVLCSPEFDGIFNVKPPRFLLFKILGLLIGGTLLKSIDSSIFEHFGNMSEGFAANLSVSLKVAGVSFFGLGVWCAFGRLPIR